MEIIKINYKAVKVILNKEECEKYEFISGESISDRVMLMSLDSLLLEVKERESIDLMNGKLLVQIYPTKNLGCEIYICDTEEDKLYRDKGAQTGIKKATSCTGIYRFDSIDKLLYACCRLADCIDDEASQVYYDSCNERYYLVSTGIAPRELRFAFLNEYAKQIKLPYIHHIREHLRCICYKNAIKTMSSLA
ncbi:MAG: adaptor protein MecA [Clostridia bacterium]|nr:adaptor protein MecA [Clostridia bacterium]